MSIPIHSPTLAPLTGTLASFPFVTPQPAPDSIHQEQVPQVLEEPQGSRRTQEQGKLVEESPQSCVRLIDMNQLPPDGSLEALEGLTKAIGTALSNEVYLGVIAGQQLLRAGLSTSNQPGVVRETAVENGLREAATATKSCLFASRENQSSLTLQSLRQELDAKCLLGFGLTNVPVPCGVILVLSESEVKKSGEELSRMVEQLRRELSDWLTIWYHCYTGKSARSWLNRIERFSKHRKYWKWYLLGLVVCLGVPVPYWPKRECLIEPTFRRYLTSPTDGRILDATVRPGDVVQPNQLLARIDDDQIRWELAKAEAEYQQAQKKRDTALASRSGGEARLADLEKDRIKAQIRSLENQLSQLEIRSPIAGIVIAGDWVPTAGATVRRADTLFEVAPLEKMRIQTLLSTEDLGQIAVGTPMTLRVDAAYGLKWLETIQRIDPRGRPENSKVVFYAEADVDNQSQALRPGMRGTVRLAPGTRSLGWIILHRPYLWMMKKLAW